jgi:phosphatidylglycerol:prolipoprotein diacylglycerol transferase
VAVFTMLVGMIFARIGCLLHGCCCGRPSRSWISLHLPNHAGRWEMRLPTQCLEAGVAVILLVFAIAVRRTVAFPGALFWQVTVGYASGRLVLESTREERRDGQFSIHHVISLILIVVSCAALKAHWPP